MKEIINKLSDKNKKLQSLDIAARWNKLVQIMLKRDKNQLGNKTLKRWHRLILVANRKGVINLR